MQQACRDANANVPSSVGSFLVVLSYLGNNRPRYEVAVNHLNTELKEAVDIIQEPDASLATGGTGLAQSVSEITGLNGELNTAVVGGPATEASLDAWDSDI